MLTLSHPLFVEFTLDDIILYLTWWYVDLCKLSSTKPTVCSNTSFIFCTDTICFCFGNAFVKDCLSEQWKCTFVIGNRSVYLWTTEVLFCGQQLHIFLFMCWSAKSIMCALSLNSVINPTPNMRTIKLTGSLCQIYFFLIFFIVFWRFSRTKGCTALQFVVGSSHFFIQRVLLHTQDGLPVIILLLNDK